MAEPTIDTLFLAGEVHALITVTHVLLATHPHPQSLSVQLQAAEQAGLAHAETQLAGDQLVLGYQSVMRQFRNALEAAPET